MGFLSPTTDMKPGQVGIIHFSYPIALSQSVKCMMQDCIISYSGLLSSVIWTFGSISNC